MKVLILDRDGTITHNSSAPESPFYYILKPEHLVLKPNVARAFDLLRVIRATSDLKVVLATRQGCISKGLVTRAAVDDINRRLEEMLGFQFDQIYVEESAPTKYHLYDNIKLDYDANELGDVAVIDDSPDERDAAYRADCMIVWHADLYSTICRLFNINL